MEVLRLKTADTVMFGFRTDSADYRGDYSGETWQQELPGDGGQAGAQLYRAAHHSREEAAFTRFYPNYFHFVEIF